MNKTGFNVELRFSIGLHNDEKALLELIRNTLNIGRIGKQGAQYSVFRLSSIKEIEILINHLDKYPPLTQKGIDYLL
jgi:hypothetical protein